MPARSSAPGGSIDVKDTSAAAGVDPAVAARTEGLTGVGLDSGATYTDRSHGTQTGIASIPEGFATGGFALRVRISSTEADTATLVVSHRFHLVKRDGVNRLVIDEFTVTCG